MLVTAFLTLNRDTHDAHVEVSGTVTAGCTHPGCDCLYTVALDAPTLRDLLPEEHEAADRALGEKWMALHPYGLDALEAA